MRWYRVHCKLIGRRTYDWVMSVQAKHPTDAAGCFMRLTGMRLSFIGGHTYGDKNKTFTFHARS